MRRLIALLLLLTTGSALSQSEDHEAELRAARERLDAAARELAELHRRYGPPPGFDVRVPAPVRLGMVLGRPGAEGIELVAVTPAGSAAEAGLAAGDLITRMNDRSMSGRGFEALHQVDLDIEALNPGDYVSVEYRRDGQDYAAELAVPEADAPYAMADGVGTVTVATAGQPIRGHGPMFGAVAFARPVGVMLYDVNPGLGRYFGVDSGVLVLQGGDDPLALMAGDVITEVDGTAVADRAQLVAALSPDKRPVTVLRDGGALVLQLDQGQLDGGPPGFIGAAPGANVHFINLGDGGATATEPEAQP